jgi:hypothetical protein
MKVKYFFLLNIFALIALSVIVWRQSEKISDLEYHEHDEPINDYDIQIIASRIVEESTASLQSSIYSLEGDLSEIEDSVGYVDLENDDLESRINGLESDVRFLELR